MKSKVTREQYERAKTILARWDTKVSHAKALVKHWEAVEQMNKDRIGKNVLKAIVTDQTGSSIQFESPIQLAVFDEEEADGVSAAK